MCAARNRLANKPFLCSQLRDPVSLTATQHTHISPIKWSTKWKLQNVNSKSVRYTYMKFARRALELIKQRTRIVFRILPFVRIELPLRHTHPCMHRPNGIYTHGCFVQSILASIICMSIVRIVVCAARIRFLYLRKFVQCVCESYLIVVVIVIIDCRCCCCHYCCCRALPFYC